jgi:putative PIN family toxin of toxin-antitoxin system
MRAVFDTNVLLAAFITEGVCSKLLHRARKREFSLITCPFILHEAEEKLRAKLKAGRDEANGVMTLIKGAAQSVVEPKQKVSGVCRDRDDDNVLACAVAAKADYIVTGDKDLLELEEFQRIRIVTPRDFELLFKD